LNPATVGRIVSKLLQNDLLQEVGAAPSRGGRRATLVGYNHKAGTVIGLDLNGVYLLGVLADLGGDFLHRIELPGSPIRDAQENLNSVYDIIQELLDSEPHVPDSLRGIGISTPSVTINPEGIVAMSAHLGWENMHLKSLLEDRFGYHVFVQNESNLGALAESLWGAGQKATRLVCLDVGVGIGSGIVINKRLYQGAHHAAGEVGNLIPGIQYLGRTFDTFGCMETISCCTAMLDKARQAIADGDQGLLRDRLNQTETLTASDVFGAARQNDPLAQRLVYEMADYVSQVAVSIITVLDPDLIVLGQDLAEAGDLFIPRIRAQIEGLVGAMPRIVTSELKTEAVIRGAVALALQATEEQFYVTRSTFSEPFVM
jgi:predicted NBD/HSP70 family sugar kinase